LIAQACGKDFNVVERDSSCACYLSPDEAVACGLIDKVLLPDGSGMLIKGGSAVNIPANEVRIIFMTLIYVHIYNIFYFDISWLRSRKQKYQTVVQ
jgi:hypothetical protein